LLGTDSTAPAPWTVAIGSSIVDKSRASGLGGEPRVHEEKAFRKAHYEVRQAGKHSHHPDGDRELAVVSCAVSGLK
jgi:hypothetical protein